MKIGFFDSGIGGISVLHRALQVLPYEDYIYYADTEHTPYGEKTTEEILSYADEALRFFTEHNVKAVVVACNTATSVAAPYLRKKYSIPIIGMEPAVKLAICNSKHKRVLVCATPVTCKMEKLHRLLNAVDLNHEVDLLPLPGLVHFAEAMEFDSPAVEAYLREELSRYPIEEYTSLVLGCTHFNYFKKVFRRILLPETSLIDGCSGTIRQLWKLLEFGFLLEYGEGSTEYYFSGKPATEEQLRQIEQIHSHLEEMQQIF